MTKTCTNMYGGIEMGGTKFVCAMGTGPNDLRVIKQFPTTTPAENIGKIMDFFKLYRGREPLSAVGIASFGPLDLNPKSPTYGFITNTPKGNWAGFNLSGSIRDALGVPVVINTDVNGAALGEWKWGAAQELDTFIYLTIGTGIGGGGIINGELMHGLVHPEMGHIRIPHDLKLDPFTGSCPFHGDCWEGLASGESMEKRWGRRPEDILPSDPDYKKAWMLEANYIAVGTANLICTLSPQRVILGGGIMKHDNLLPAIQKKIKKLLNKYVSSPEILKRIDHYLVLPEHMGLSGVLGAIALAMQLK